MEAEKKLDVLQQIVCVYLQPHIWSGTRRLRPDELHFQEGKKPPSSIVSLGSKKVFDKKHLAPFEAKKKEAERVCEAVGVRFLGGYAVQVGSFPEVQKMLDAIKADWADLRGDFRAAFPDRFEKWCDADPEWAEFIRKAAPSVDYVMSAISFDWAAFRVNDLDSSENDLGAGGLNRQVGGLAGQLLHEVAVKASKTWDQSYSGKTEVTRKALSPIKWILRKLESLSFVDPCVLTIVKQVRAVLAEVPKDGAIQGRVLEALSGTLLVMSEEEKLLAHATGLWTEARVCEHSELLTESSPLGTLDNVECDDNVNDQSESSEDLEIGGLSQTSVPAQPFTPLSF